MVTESLILSRNNIIWNPYFFSITSESDLYFEKNLPDTFTSKKFSKYVEAQGYKEIALCGLDECGCVGATAKGAVRRGIKTYMLTDSIGRRFSADKVSKMRETLKAISHISSVERKVFPLKQR